MQHKHYHYYYVYSKYVHIKLVIFLCVPISQSNMNANTAAIKTLGILITLLLWLTPLPWLWLTLLPWLWLPIELCTYIMHIKCHYQDTSSQRKYNLVLSEYISVLISCAVTYAYVRTII